LPYVLVAVVVPIALICATLIMERFEQRVVGPPAHANEDRCGPPPPALPQPSTVEHHIVAEPPRAA
jgi:hypothetical protein